MRDLLRLAGLLRPHLRRAALGAALAVLAAAANVALLALSSWFIASMALAGAMGVVMEYNLPGTAVRALALLRAGARYAERLVNHDTTLRILSSLRAWFFRRVEPLAPARTAGLRGGDLLSRVRADVDRLDDFYVRGLVPAAVAILSGAAFAAYLARWGAGLALVDAAGLLLGGVGAPLLLRALANRPGRERVALAAELRASVVEQVQGMAELVALGALPRHAEAVERTSRALERKVRTLSSLQGAGDAVLVAASSLALWAAVAMLAPRVAAGTLPPAALPLLAVFVLASFESVTPLPAALQKAGEMAAAARRLFALVDETPAAVDPPTPAAAPRAGSGGLALTFRGVRFRYEPGGPPVFDGLDLEVGAGRRLAVTGPTGAGKSTLVGILLRFWDYEGSVSVAAPGGPRVELRDLAGTDARRLFSVLPQSPHLFHATLRENLQVAAPEGVDFDDAALRDALETAQLGGLLAGLPAGLDTVVGETGRQLSVGEARRVALARALLREAPVYVLDEPTEGLDPATAAAVLAAIDRRLRGRTVIVITHRREDLVLADAAIALERGTSVVL